MNINVMELINNYLQTARECIAKMECKYNRGDLLSAYREKAIPKNGTIGGMIFEFHGVGCWFEFNGIECDVDFGPENRTDGFDAWKLSRYAEQFEKFREFRDIDRLQKTLNRLEAEGCINKFGEPPRENLYHLVKAIKGH